MMCRTQKQSRADNLTDLSREQWSLSSKKKKKEDS